MNRRLPRAALLEGAALLGAGGLAFALRTIPLWPRVVGPDIRLVETDAYLHARLVHALVVQPARMEFDPYALYPGGLEVRVGPLFDHLAAWLARLVGGWHPSEREIERACALLLPLLAALLVVPVWASARALGGRLTGLAAAFVVATIPGELFSRSVLGFSDHHILESVTWAATLATVGHALGARDTRRAALRGVLGGLALGAYLCAFVSGVLGVAMLALPLCVELVVRHPDTRPPLAALLVTLGIATVLLYTSGALYGRAWSVLALGGVAGAIVALGAVSAALRRLPRPAFWLLAPAAAFGCSIATWHASPELASQIHAHSSRFFPGASSLTVGEVNPLLRMGGQLDLPGAVWQLGPAWLGLFAGAVLLARRFDSPHARLQLLAGAGMFLAAFYQRRFCYYLAVHAAVASGLAIAWLASRRRWAIVPAAAILVAMVALGGRAGLALAARAPTMPDAWAEALAWLRQSTPEPFGFANAYLGHVDRATYRAPKTAYGVLAWWDYGYWIEAVGRRLPIANPTQAGTTEVARVLLARRPDEAIADLERQGVRYLVLDDLVAVGAPNWKLWAVARYASGPYSDRWAYTRPRPGHGREPVYFAGYHEALVVRLFVFGGAAARPPSGPTLIAKVAPRADEPGEVEVVDLLRRPTRAAAEAYVAEHPDTRLASQDPYTPVVPLEALPRFGLAYDARRDHEGDPPPLRIFVLHPAEAR